MSGPVLTKSLTRLRSDFNEAFPTRDKESDGWIGDEAHQEHTSGHNPDDTPGSRAEYSDGDTKQEVRAIDVDADINSAKYTMLKVIEQILNNPNDTRRLAYIIFDHVIWSANTNWEPHEYTGESSHEEHAHFSGDPDYDEDDSSWEIGDDMEQTDLLHWSTPNNPNRKVGQVFTDVSELRDWYLTEEGAATSLKPAPTSNLGALSARVKKLEGWAADTTAQLTRIEDALGGGSPLPDVGNDDVLEALATLQRTVDGLVNGVKANASAVSS
jgi:hypothetical protein